MVPPLGQYLPSGPTQNFSISFVSVCRYDFTTFFLRDPHYRDIAPPWADTYPLLPPSSDPTYLRQPRNSVSHITDKLPCPFPLAPLPFSLPTPLAGMGVLTKIPPGVPPLGPYLPLGLTRFEPKPTPPLSPLHLPLYPFHVVHPLCLLLSQMGGEFRRNNFQGSPT